MPIPDDVRQSTIATLEHHAGVLQGAVDAARTWAVTRPRWGYRVVDRKRDERMVDLVARALYGIWEGTFLEARLEHAHDPWVVSLVGHSHNPTDPTEDGEDFYVNTTGVAAEGAASALLNAINGAVEQLRREIVLEDA